MDFSVVIPVYNTTATLEILYKDIKELFIKRKNSFEIIFIDDCSTNSETWQKLLHLRRKDKRIKLIQLWNNHGQQKAVLAGIMHANGKFCITMDDDLQHNPKDIEILINRIIRKKNIDVVIGVSTNRKGKHSLIQNVGSVLLNKIDEIIFSKPKGVIRGSFRIMKKEVYVELPKISNNTPTIGSLIYILTRGVENVSVNLGKRNDGKSGYSVSQLVNLAFDTIFYYSTWPLRFIALIGLCFFLFSAVISMWVFYRRLFHDIHIEGWASLLIISASGLGILMAGMGIIGEYIIRLIRNSTAQNLTILIRKKYL